MDRNGQVRKEPTLADLEAFEKLLRDSLQIEPVGGAVGTPAASAQAPEVSAPQVSAPHAASTADQAAMAELARLIDTPVSFDPPAGLSAGLRGPVAPSAPAPVASEGSGNSSDTLHHTHGSIEAALAEDWQATPSVETRFSAPAAAAESHPAYAAPGADPLDPLAAFEEELRRFDIARTAELQVHAAPQEQGRYAGQTEFEPHHAAQPQPAHAAQSFETGNVTPQYQHGEPDWFAAQPAGQPDYAAESQAESSLNAAEERLAAEAAAAAAASGAVAGAGRSKGIFLALGGIAVAGLAVIGGSLMMNSGKKGGGDVPTIAARPEPTKERPADPGGVDIPNQNKQVLAARNTPETKPASVINTTEQPLDLNQVTKRDSVRVITQSPFQNQPPQATPATGTAGSPAPGGPAVEPRRVTSVRIPIGGGDTATLPTGGSAPTQTAAAVAGASAVATGATARTSTQAPVPPTRPDPGATANVQTPAKVESRPATAQPVAETPKVTPPKVATAPAAPKVTPPKANAPLALDAPRSAAGNTGGGYAIQLASRPTEADARSASTQLKSKFAGTLGSRSPSVVSGEANGQTVYRVRVGGYSQADAVAACTRIKAAGGGCFVTKQ
ncbi:MAG: sporulation domain-containing [Beijerinckiaceae bacterium]|nr:MAG: sporulation domain-containing [Beijerinckiaceae bacterium]